MPEGYPNFQCRYSFLIPILLARGKTPVEYQIQSTVLKRNVPKHRSRTGTVARESLAMVGFDMASSIACASHAANARNERLRASYAICHGFIRNVELPANLLSSQAKIDRAKCR
jgi:hypothetical protein